MFDVNQVYKIENFLTEKQIEGLDYFSSHYVWEPEGHSYDSKKVFWIKDLWESKWGECVHIEETFRTKIENLLQVKLQTKRLYYNGQSHGQCGSMHNDMLQDEEGDFITVVYYANKQWSPEYGGFTVIVDNNDNMHIVYPKPNSVVIFNSRFAHVGLEPTSNFAGVRTTIAHKLKVIS